MDAKANAILLMAITKPSKVKDTQPLCKPYTKRPTKRNGYAEAMAMVAADGKEDWVRFKSECVLLTQKKGE